MLSTGFIFYYWPYYKKLCSTDASANPDQIHQWSYNNNAHGGYKQSELFVDTKYDNLKYEIMNNKINTLSTYQ